MNKGSKRDRRGSSRVGRRRSLELAAIFKQLAERLEHIELSGPVDRMRSSFLVGAKRMPIRYRLRPRSNG